MAPMNLQSHRLCDLQFVTALSSYPENFDIKCLLFLLKKSFRIYIPSYFCLKLKPTHLSLHSIMAGSVGILRAFANIWSLGSPPPYSHPTQC